MQKQSLEPRGLAKSGQAHGLTGTGSGFTRQELEGSVLDRSGTEMTTFRCEHPDLWWVSSTLY